jgi:hypothetical protein
LVDMYNKIEMISLNYKLDELPQDQVQWLVNEVKELISVIRR